MATPEGSTFLWQVLHSFLFKVWLNDDAPLWIGLGKERRWKREMKKEKERKKTAQLKHSRQNELHLL